MTTTTNNQAHLSSSSSSSSLRLLCVCIASLASLTFGCDAEDPGVESSESALENLEVESCRGGHGTPDDKPSRKTTIPLRVFSTSPSLGAKSTSVSDHNSPNYSALAVFFDKVKKHTRHDVAFQIASWSASTSTSIIQQVGINNDAGEGGVARDAAYDSGTALNPVWGFMYNSIPFGPDFDLVMRFLYEEGGLDLAQSLVDARNLNVKVLPVVGSPAQGSGYFKAPIGGVQCEGDSDCLRQKSIGLQGLCQAGWTFRYLPPAQNVIDSACDQLVKERIIPAKSIKFISSIPGKTVLGAVQQGDVTAFEFATPLDDYDPPTAGSGFFPALASPLAGRVEPAASQNPGHKGLRFAHFASWHQPYYVGWLMLNKTEVWNKLSHSNRRAIEHAAKEALEESYWYSKSLQCKALKKILDHNDHEAQLDADGKPIVVSGKPVSADMKLSEWPSDALARLKKATDEYLESVKGSSTPSADQKDYAQVLRAYQSFIKKTGYKWDPKHFDYSRDCRH
jgi:hypothetical protein